MTQKSVIIVAGGSGKRMGSEIPKQFIKIEGKPILMHTIEAFYKYDPNIQIVVVLPELQHKLWSDFINELNFEIKHTVTKGGAERFHSVKNGLSKLMNAGIVAIHDGVRPLVRQETIQRCFDICLEEKAVIPIVPATESIRKIKDGTSTAVNRSHYFMVQTPQVFDVKLLQKAYEQEFDNTFTDDASVVEKLGYEIFTVEGNPENIKITRPMDIKIAEVLLKEKVSKVR